MMQKFTLSWSICVGVLLLCCMGLLLPNILTQRTSGDNPSSGTRQKLPQNVVVTPIADDALAYSFSVDNRHIFYVSMENNILSINKYSVESNLSKIMARYQMPNSRSSIAALALGDDGTTTVLVKPRHGAGDAALFVCRPNQKHRSFTLSLEEDATVMAVADGAAAVAGVYTQPKQLFTKQRLIDWNRLNSEWLKVEPLRLNDYIRPVPQSEYFIPKIHQPSPESRSVSGDDFGNNHLMHENHTMLEDGKKYYPIFIPKNSYRTMPSFPVEERLYRPDINLDFNFGSGGGGGGDEPFRITPGSNTVRETFLFCSTGNRQKSRRVVWSGVQVIAVNRTASIVVGNYQHNGKRSGFLWRVGRSLRSLQYPKSNATQIIWLSPDDSYVLGLASVNQDKTILFRWSRRKGYQKIAELPASISNLSVICIGSQGKSVVFEEQTVDTRSLEFTKSYLIWSSGRGLLRSRQLGNILKRPICITNDGSLILSDTNWGMGIVKIR